MLDLPKVGKEYTWQQILTIAESRGLNYVVYSLNTPIPPPKPFISDG